MNSISFKTAIFSGDVIYQMAGVRQVCNAQNARAEYYLWLNRESKLYDGAVHPYGGKMQTEYSYQMLKPLIEAQPYIAFLKPWNGEQIQVEMDVIRQVNIGLPYGCIGRWQFMMFPDMNCDLGEPWLDVTGENPDVKDKIIVNRTSRYQNAWLHYYFLKNHQDRIIFAGLSEEHAAFQKEWSLDIPYLQVKDFYELAVSLKSCKFFIGNQSMCYAIAEAMKIPRMLEICPFVPNVMPYGKNGYDFIKQEACEYYFNKLMKEL